MQSERVLIVRGDNKMKTNISWQSDVDVGCRLLFGEATYLYVFRCYRFIEIREKIIFNRPICLRFGQFSVVWSLILVFGFGYIVNKLGGIIDIFISREIIYIENMELVIDCQ